MVTQLRSVWSLSSSPAYLQWVSKHDPHTSSSSCSSTLLAYKFSGPTQTSWNPARWGICLSDPPGDSSVYYSVRATALVRLQLCFILAFPGKLWKSLKPRLRPHLLIKSECGSESQVSVVLKGPAGNSERQASVRTSDWLWGLVTLKCGLWTWSMVSRPAMSAASPGGLLEMQNLESQPKPAESVCTSARSQETGKHNKMWQALA